MDTTVMIEEHPQIKELMAKRPIVWQNPDYGKRADLPLTRADIFDAVARWERFAPFMAVAFPETAAMNGIIESPLLPLEQMKPAWEALNHQSLAGQLYLKADSQLPISGSIKSRGGIYEVLKFAEQVAMAHTDLTYMDDYSVLATAKYDELFAQYGVIVASTGNLALSVGIMAATFGFKTTVYMSHDARQWKKDKLRANGVTVEELNTDFSSVIPVARAAAAKDDHTHFVDDEGSRDLFLGYAVAGVRLQHQLKVQGIKMDAAHPVVVYLLAADGLAVSRPSRLAGKVMQTLLLGTATFEDDDLYRYLTKLVDTEDVMVEPSAAAGFTAIAPIMAQFPTLAGKDVTHIVWATGGDMMPESERQLDYELGQKLLTKINNR